MTAFVHTVWHYTVLFQHNTDDRIKHLQDVKDERDKRNEKEK